MASDAEVEFAGDAGKHSDEEGQDCAGRSFEPMLNGVGGAHLNTVECLTCGRQLAASENGLMRTPS
jgi:hypothetical protein